MTKTDFSGTWRFDPAESTLQIRAPDSTTFVIEHREPSLRLSRTHVVGGQSDAFEVLLTTDGRETVVERGGVELRCRASWDGETLVFDTRFVRGGEEAHNLVRYTMAGDRRSFVAIERFRSSGLSYDNRWRFERA